MKTMRCLLLAGSVFLLALAPGCGESPRTDEVTPPPAPRTSPNDRAAPVPGAPVTPPAPGQPGAVPPPGH